MCAIAVDWGWIFVQPLSDDARAKKRARTEKPIIRRVCYIPFAATSFITPFLPHGYMYVETHKVRPVSRWLVSCGCLTETIGLMTHFRTRVELGFLGKGGGVFLMWLCLPGQI